MNVFRDYDEVVEIDPLQRLVLEALLLPAPRDAERHALWLERADFGAIDATALRLLPALVAKFGSPARDDPRGVRMKGAYRRSQFRNALLFADGWQAVRQLAAAGIEVLLFKGIATALCYHDDPAARPMGDIDALVRREDAARAGAVLEQLGWRVVYPPWGKTADVHSRDYVNARGSGVDLHWYALFESPLPDIDEDLWRRARRHDWDGVAVRVMSAEDLLLTTLVNALRTADAAPLHWVLDVARIIASEPAIEWSIVWDEAARRGLRSRVFDALNLVRGISREVIGDGLLDAFVEQNPELHRELLAVALAEGRTHGIDRERAAALASAPAGDASTIGASHSARHVRFFRDQRGSIERLFLQRRHLAWLSQLFDVRDPQALGALVAAGFSGEEGFVDVPTGLLETRAQPWLGSSYQASMTIPDAGARRLDLAPGEVRRVRLEVRNDSLVCWVVDAGSPAIFGVSYHLLSPDGRVLVQEFPRQPLITARKAYVAFIEPSQTVRCELALVAPDEPGRYVARLDLVHEHFAWFSNQGCHFPEIEIVVRKPRAAGRYAPCGVGVVHDMRGDEAVIIDTVTGTYYTLNRGGAIAWKALAAGHDIETIARAFVAAGASGAEEGIERFLDALLAEGLIAESGSPERSRLPALEVGTLAEPPAITRHAETRALVLRHPFRDASPSKGWPEPREAPTPTKSGDSP